MTRIANCKIAVGSLVEMCGRPQYHPDFNGYVCERYNAWGEPTGVFHEALKIAVVDYGGNVWGTATTVRGVARIQNKLRLPTQLSAIEVSERPAFD